MKSILLLSLIAVSGACVDQTDDQLVDDGFEDVPRLAVNGITPSQIQYTNLDAAPLTNSAIATLASTSNGRAFLNYVVTCALDSTQSLTSGGYTFTGNYGMVPGWTTSALSLSDRRWISACVLARVNYLATSMTISMRGTHAALVTTPTELSNYAIQEGTFYGDIFGGNYARHACADAGVFNGQVANLKPRRCAMEYDAPLTFCEFVYDGACASNCTVSGNGYSSCTDSTGATWAEVIKVNL